jgi:hypothetical protein
MDNVTWSEVLRVLLMVSGTALVLATLLGIWVWQRVKRLRLPEDATFIEAMRLTPFSVVVFLDLLDLGLDVFSAPVGWLVLGHLGLRQLRGATLLESVIPGTQFLPTMTTAWVLVRLFGPKLEEIPFLQEAVNVGARNYGGPKRLQDIPRRYRPSRR